MDQPETRREYHTNGILKCRWQIYAKPDGGMVRHGLYESWFPDGSRESKGNFENGLLQGTWNEWWPDGFLRTTGEYISGEKHGLWVSYGHAGKSLELTLFRAGISVFSAGARLDAHGNGFSEIEATHGGACGCRMLASLESNGHIKHSEYVCDLM